MPVQIVQLVEHLIQGSLGHDGPTAGHLGGLQKLDPAVHEAPELSGFWCTSAGQAAALPATPSSSSLSYSFLRVP